MKKPATNGLENCGQVIRELREQFSLTQEALARRLGPKWDRTRINKLEQDVNPLTRRVIHQLARAFEQRPERLYLACLKAQYPVLQTSEVGELLDQVIDHLDDDDDDDKQVAE